VLRKIDPNERTADVTQDGRTLQRSIQEYGTRLKDLELRIGGSEVASVARNRGYGHWGARNRKKTGRWEGWIYADIIDQPVAGRGVYEELDSEGIAIVEQTRFREAGKRKERPFKIDRDTGAQVRREIDGGHAQFSDCCLVSAALLLFEQQFIAEVSVVRPIDENPRVKRRPARRGLRAEIWNEPAF
jgi:hypothetical protein